MALAPTPCATTGCNALAVRYGTCQEHQRPAFYGSTKRQRTPKDWQTRRLIVLKRDKGICYLCGQAGADRVDHVIANDNHSLSNLKAVHDAVEPHCHRYKTAKEGIKGFQNNKVRRRH